ncbi:hypothetical protein [Ciceribacter lividus]|uniref:hypothetical protein n=1 Tax=Ciceribacter lividus TaxID=1197950 RepID=UPI001475140D|nr:hypothetical protein [Ciceribacter lividus]
MMLSMAVDFVGGHFPIGCKTAEKSEWPGQIIKAWTSVNPASQNVMDALFGGYGLGAKIAGKNGFRPDLRSPFPPRHPSCRKKQRPADHGSAGQGY